MKYLLKLIHAILIIGNTAAERELQNKICSAKRLYLTNNLNFILSI